MTELIQKRVLTDSSVVGSDVPEVEANSMFTSKTVVAWFFNFLSYLF